MSTRVLIADDQQLVRTGFRLILDSEPDIEVIGEATNGREAVTMARELRPDVILMDIRMPELDGIEATRQVIDIHGERTTRVLILTTFDLDEYVYDALRAGASGFLLKDVPADQLAAGVRMVAAGDALLAPRDHPPPDRAVRSHRACHRHAGRHRRTHAARARGVPAGGQGDVECGDRQPALHRRNNCQNARHASADEAWGPRPRTSSGAGLRSWDCQSQPPPEHDSGFGLRVAAGPARRVSCSSD
jgi:DNA-binding NarL/FixJ family response regulator